MKNEKPSEFAGATTEALARALLCPIRSREPQPKPASRKEAAKEAAR